jgi:hypothetical protein
MPPKLLPLPKKNATKNDYQQAVDRLLNEFVVTYMNAITESSEREEMMTSINEGRELIRSLITKYIDTVYTSACDVRLFNTTKTSATSNTNPGQTTKHTIKRRISAWQIFLKFAPTIIPDYAKSPNKTVLTTNYYKHMSAAEKQDICNRYYAQYPSEAPPVKSCSRGHGARGGLNGWTVFSTEWYEKQKLLNPDVKGLQAKACGAAWQQLSDDEKQKYNDRAVMQVQ